MAKLTRGDVERIVKEAREKGEIPDLKETDLSEVDLSGADLFRADLSGVDLIEADLSGADLSGADLSEADLSRVNLSKAKLSGANLFEAILHRADLSEANLSMTDLSGADLSGADLTGAKLREAKLSRAILIKTNLRDAKLRETDLTKVKLENTNFSRATIGDTVFVNVDLSGALNLESVQHQAPSAIDMSTIHQSQDKIPKMFLMGAGIHPDIIRWQHSLHARPTVFISYNYKDEMEKDQLLTHLSILQRNDLIDLWHNQRIPGGADWKEEIKKAMARASVAILLISANFMNSDFIFEEEIPTFLERQKSTEKLHIYPIIAKSCSWQAIDWLAKMEVRPKGGNPIWGKDADTNAELAKIANEITNIIKELMFKQDQADK